jgi:hypothetical protein
MPQGAATCDIIDAMMSHFILTRFNPRIGEGLRGLDEDWLEARIALFEDFCAPSVRRQTCQDFIWLVFFDVRTPPAVRQRIDELVERFRFEPVWLDGEFSVRVASEQLRRRCQLGDLLITTSLDNDDALHPRYVAMAHEHLEGALPGFLSFPHGAQLAYGHFYRRPYLGNPFLSRLERVDDNLSTVYDVAHWLPQNYRPKFVWTREPAWLQIVHGDNLANDLRGVWVRPSSMARIFDIPPDRYAPDEIRLSARWRRRLSSLTSLAPTADLRRRLGALRSVFTSFVHSGHAAA